jgi:hypothetical protein
LEKTWQPEIMPNHMLMSTWKRNHMYEDDGVEKLSKKIGDVAFAIQSLSKNQLDVNELYTRVMKIEGFNEITLEDAFDHLVQNEMLAKTFMTKKMLI